MVWIPKEKRERSGIQSEELKSTAKGEEKYRDIRRMLKVLREVWLNIRIEKVDIHESITVKALLDSSAMGMFINKRTMEKHGFKLRKLERPLIVRNVNRTGNSRGNITHQVEVNIFYKNHMERMQMDVYNLGKTEVILRMSWLQAHNSEINWETGEVKITRCPPLCERNLVVKEDIE